MALLTEAQRQAVTNVFMRDRSEKRDVLPGVKKTDLRAAIDATDQWIEDNQASYNSALPAVVRTNLSLAQKTLLFCYVAMKRGGIL